MTEYKSWKSVPNPSAAFLSSCFILFNNIIKNSVFWRDLSFSLFFFELDQARCLNVAAVGSRSIGKGQVLFLGTTLCSYATYNFYHTYTRTCRRAQLVPAPINACSRTPQFRDSICYSQYTHSTPPVWPLIKNMHKHLGTRWCLGTTRGNQRHKIKLTKGNPIMNTKRFLNINLKKKWSK
jgi:hypothetical protein